MKYYLGIDPGKTGGLAIVNEEGGLEACFSTAKENWSTLGHVFEVYKEYECLVALEKVGAMPGQGVTSMFTFGANFGGWVSLLEYLAIPYILVPPQKWQKYILGAIPKGESKQRAFAYISRRFPLSVFKKSDTGIVDALCLALYIKDNH